VVLSCKILILSGGKRTLVIYMKIGILSDTHDNISCAETAIDRLNQEQVDLVLHAGDFIAPFMIGILKKLEAQMIGVFGNNDGDRPLLLQKCRETKNLEIRGTFARIDLADGHIALLHGSDPVLLRTLNESGIFDLVVAGHTHRAEVAETGRTLVVNPGEVCGYLTGKSTIAVVDMPPRHAKIIEL